MPHFKEHIIYDICFIVFEKKKKKKPISKIMCYRSLAYDHCEWNTGVAFTKLNLQSIMMPLFDIV